MLRSLYSGISGLRSHQAMLDVTGNNIANVNTTGFKSSAVQFQDTLSQMLKNGSAPGTESGSTDAAQVGLGVKVAGMSTNFAQGAGQATGRPDDLMISGDGFFAVRSGGSTSYTRAGSLNFDTQGRLVTPEGGFVQGWSAVNGAVSTGGAVGNITLDPKSLSAAAATISATIAGSLPSDAAVGSAPVVREIQKFDATGGSTTVNATFTKTATGWSVSDGAGGPSTDLTFDANGKISTAVTTPANPLTTVSTVPVGGVDIDLSGLSQLSGLSTASLTKQDGHAAGTLESYAIGDDGTITGSYSNGTTAPIARIALATFTNPGGLEKAGGSTYTATASSGMATLGAPGSAGVGSLSGGYLEMSNVDLSQEFTNLIVAQRGFQANARIITVSDQVLDELTSLKR
jgi:flagellar hook protein FlgE